jgi:integrase/recombinase XerD
MVGGLVPGFAYVPPLKGSDRMSVGEAVSAFLATLSALGLNVKTLKAYSAALNSFANFVGRDRLVSEVTLDDYIRWLSKLRGGGLKGGGGVSDSTIHYYSVFVRRFLRWAGLKAEIPVVPRAKSGFSDALTWDDVERLVRASRDYVDLVAVTLMAESGIRASELLSLRAVDIDLHSGVARVTGKYGKQRIVILGPLSRAVLADYMVRSRLNPGDRLINISYQALYKRLKKLAYIAGVDVERVRPHVLRHTFATEAIRRGMSLPALQKLLGHSDLKITQLYLHLTNDDVRREYEKVFLQQSMWPHQGPMLNNQLQGPPFTGAETLTWKPRPQRVGR